MNKEEISKYRSEVIERAINIEWLMSIVICQHYFKKVMDKFLFEVMYDEYCSFALKRRIIEKIVNEGSINIQKLNRIITIRNYFAHRNQEIVSKASPEQPFVPDPRDTDKPIDFVSLYNEFTKLTKEIELALVNIYIQKGGELKEESEN
jgi:hypothetical protein